MNRRAEERLQLAREVRQAMQQERFSLCYQPQYDLATGRMAAVEALIRWRDENGALVPPTRIIPLADDTELVVSLGTWVLEEATRQAQQWREQGLDFGRLADCDVVQPKNIVFTNTGTLPEICRLLGEPAPKVDYLSTLLFNLEVDADLAGREAPSTIAYVGLDDELHERVEANERLPRKPYSILSVSAHIS